MFIIMLLVRKYRKSGFKNYIVRLILEIKVFVKISLSNRSNLVLNVVIFKHMLFKLQYWKLNNEFKP